MEKFVIKGNEIKESGVFGKTVYVIKGNEIKEPGLLGRTAYKIDGKEIKETGLGGKTLFVIDGNKIKKHYKKTGLLESAISGARRGFESASNNKSQNNERTNQQRSNKLETNKEKQSIFNKRNLIIVCLVIVLLASLAIFISQLSSLIYFTELNNIEYSEEFIMAIETAKSKSIFSGIAIALESIFIVLFLSKKRKKPVEKS